MTNTTLIENMDWATICDLLYERVCEGQCVFSWKNQEWEVVGCEEEEGEDPVAVFTNKDGSEVYRYTYSRNYKVVTRIVHSIEMPIVWPT